MFALRGESRTRRAGHGEPGTESRIQRAGRTGLGAEEEDEHLLAAEVLDGQVPLLSPDRAVQPLVAVACAGGNTQNTHSVIPKKATS